MRRVQVDLGQIASERGSGGGKSGMRSYADEIDLLRMRSDILNKGDRVFLKMYLENGSKFTEIAQLIGISETRVSRRIKKLIKRLLDGRYVACLRNRDMLSRLELEIAKDYLIDGMSVGKIARKRKITTYKAGKAVQNINGLLRFENCRY